MAANDSKTSKQARQDSAPVQPILGGLHTGEAVRNYDVDYGKRSRRSASQSQSVQSISTNTFGIMGTPSFLRTVQSAKLLDAHVVIVILGPTGAGKSRFIQQALNLSSITVGHSLTSSTKNVMVYQFQYNGKTFGIVDTPGFDDTHRSDAEIFSEVSSWLAARYEEKWKITAVFYMQPISLTRMSGSQVRYLEVMKLMLGVQSFPYLTLVTSMWDLVQKKVAENREQELRETFWVDLLRSGARTGRFYGTTESAVAVLDVVTEWPTSAGTDNKLGDHWLAIQRELVDSSLALAHTSAGSFLDKELRKIYSFSSDKSTRIENKRDKQLLESHWNRDYRNIFLEEDDEVDSDEWDADIYKPLLDGQFRLVVLKAGTGNAPIEVSLKVENLRSPPPFAALSYVVGDGSEKVPINFRNKSTLYERKINVHLVAALTELRRSKIDILVWVDALSINSDNLDERGQQIRKMSKIFGGAQNVCIWLGEKSENTVKTLSFIKEILDFDRFEQAIREQRSIEFKRLANLLNNPWFRRRWCVQEVLLSQSATVHFGKNVLNWSDLVDIASLLSSRWHEIEGCFDPKERHIAGYSHFVGALALIDTSRKIFRLSPDGNVVERQLDLEMLLSVLPTFEVTMQHDAIFSILGLACDITLTDQIEVDYSTEPKELFAKVVSLIVARSGSLNIICRPWAPVAGLPSWIATIAKLPYKRRKAGNQYDRQHGISLVGLPSACQYRACGKYKASDTLAVHSEGVQCILPVQGFPVGIVQRLGGQCINGNIPAEWRSIAEWEDVDKYSAPPSFWSTLTAGRGVDGSAAPNWYRRACDYVFKQSTSEHTDTSLLQQIVESASVKEFLQRVRDVIWSRSLVGVGFSHPEDRFGRLSNPFFCLGPAETRLQDIVCVLYGCSVPVVLRKHGEYHTLVGECYVHGLMEGELFLGKSTSEFASEEFRLV